MSGQRRSSRPGRDRRGRFGQNFLVDADLVDRFLDRCDLAPGDLVIDVGAGRGALSLPLLDRGAQVWAVEVDHRWAERLKERLRSVDGPGSVRVIRSDFRRLRMPKQPYRVVANPPFGLTTELLAHLLDDPTAGPQRCDLIVQAEVARALARQPPVKLRAAAWAPWWRFSRGMSIPRTAFHPRPSVDAAVLTVERRDPPVLPVELAPGFRHTLRLAWEAMN